ncbi:MAG: beta-N-acetylhexosaminidase [Alphaproteobacteria bacterium]
MLNNNIKAGIFGVSGKELTKEEDVFFKELNPLGFILFARNIENKEQVKKLVADLRQTVGRNDAPVLIDQEGGRVQRLRSPIWREAPAAQIFGELLIKKDTATAIKAVKLNTMLIALELQELGINVDCLPVLDVPVENAHDVIGNRAFSKDPQVNTVLGKAVIEALLENGVFPIMKHIPGHGRAAVDSHENLPLVDTDIETLEKTDFIPFKELNSTPWAMTAHIVFSKLDANNPVTTSSYIIKNIIREYIGFDGFLLSDDLSMKALGGSYEDRTIKSLNAGCDAVLHCNGKMEEMKAVASVLPKLTPKSLERLDKSAQIMADLRKTTLSKDEALSQLNALIA